MEKKRPYYPKKWQWAEARLKALEAQRDAPREYIPSSNWRKVRQRLDARDHLYDEISKFRRMAERLKAANL